MFQKFMGTMLVLAAFTFNQSLDSTMPSFKFIDSLIPAKRTFDHPPFDTVIFSNYYYESYYDKFKDFTANTLSLNLKRQGMFGLTIKFSYLYNGTKLTLPQDVLLGFISTTDDWEYLRDSHLSMIVDTSRMNFGDLDRDGSVGDGYVTEFLSKEISLDKFLAIVNAKTVEGQLFSTEFKLTNEQLEALRDFASRMKL